MLRFGPTNISRGGDHARAARGPNAHRAPIHVHTQRMVEDCTHSSAVPARIEGSIRDKHRRASHTNTPVHYKNKEGPPDRMDLRHMHTMNSARK
jgi:hypothetical protein